MKEWNSKQNKIVIFYKMLPDSFKPVRDFLTKNIWDFLTKNCVGSAVSLAHISSGRMGSRGMRRINQGIVAFTVGWLSPAGTFAKYEAAEACVGRAVLCSKTGC